MDWAPAQQDGAQIVAELPECHFLRLYEILQLAWLNECRSESYIIDYVIDYEMY